MFDTENTALARVLAQREISVVVRAPGAPLRVRMPYAPDNRAWLSSVCPGRRPSWDGKQWNLALKYFTPITRALVTRFGRAYVVQPYNALEKCARACWQAKRLECTCSCMGEHHGAGEPVGRWYEIDDKCAFSWRSESWRWTLLRAATEPTAEAS